MIYIFEIYDRRLNEWYIDFQTRDIKIALDYFTINQIVINVHYTLQSIYHLSQVDIITQDKNTEIWLP